MSIVGKKATLAHFLATLSMKGERRNLFRNVWAFSLSSSSFSLSPFTPHFLHHFLFRFVPILWFLFPFQFVFVYTTLSRGFLYIFYLSKFCFEFLTIIIQSEKFLVSIFHFIMILLIMMKWCCSVCFSNFFVIFYKPIFPPLKNRRDFIQIYIYHTYTSFWQISMAIFLFKMNSKIF